MKQITTGDIIQIIDRFAPKKLAFSWDPIGLQVGSFKQEVKNIMVTLDVVEEVVDEAIDNDVNLIIAHHPLMFKPAKHIDVDSRRGKIIRKLIKHDITVYAAHTNLDATTDGVNDVLCDRLGINDRDHLLRPHYVENTHDEDIYFSIGRIGYTSESHTLETFSEIVKEKLEIPFVRVTGDLQTPINKVAILGGSGEKYVDDAILKGADVYITGDISFHIAQEAAAKGITLIDPGHHVEKFITYKLKEILKESEYGPDVKVIISKVDTEPFTCI